VLSQRPKTSHCVVAFVITAACAALAAFGQKNDAPSPNELSSITLRGRLLADYDYAAWHATDAVIATKPPEGSVARYVARRTALGWVVYFGRFNEKRDAFLVAYEATSGSKPEDYRVKKNDPPLEDRSFALFAATAVEIGLADFKAENRPYNVAVLPAFADQMYVYIYSAQTKTDVFPLGGDVRYLISADGKAIIEKRQLHKTILEFRNAGKPKQVVSGIHTHVLDDVPDDTDVFYVLTRKPSMPEMIGTASFIYEIKTDGTIRIVEKHRKK
jgi:hypothetical protein